MLCPLWVDKKHLLLGRARAKIIFPLTVIILLGVFSYSLFNARADVEALSNDIFVQLGLVWQYPEINDVVGYAVLNNPSSHNLDINIEFSIFNEGILITKLKGSLFITAKNVTNYGYVLRIGPITAGDYHNYKNMTATATLTIYTKICGLFLVPIYNETTNKIELIAQV